jgi:hypothetical protein
VNHDRHGATVVVTPSDDADSFGAWPTALPIIALSGSELARRLPPTKPTEAIDMMEVRRNAFGLCSVESAGSHASRTHYARPRCIGPFEIGLFDLTATLPNDTVHDFAAVDDLAQS